jgi:fucose 4-O-acetylase-like acetyltransferase
MFIWRLFLKDLVRIRGIVPLSLALGLCAGIFPEFDALLSLSRTLVFLPFFLIGYFLSEENLLSLKRPSRIFSFIIFILIMGFAFILAHTNFVPIEFLYGSSAFSNFILPMWVGLSARAFLYLIGIYFIFVLVNVMPSKPTFFSKVGGNTFPVYILHTYLLVLIFAINRLFTSLWIQIILCIVSSVFITYLLSRNFVNRYFYKFLNLLNQWVERKT